MKRIAALLATASIAFAGLSFTAAPAHACVGVQCTYSCVKRILSGNAACPD